MTSVELTVGQELTWEVHLCPESVAVCLASAEWVHRHHHRNQTTMHCDWLCLCLCYSSQFSTAVGILDVSFVRTINIIFAASTFIMLCVLQVRLTSSILPFNS